MGRTKADCRRATKTPEERAAIAFKSPRVLTVARMTAPNVKLSTYLKVKKSNARIGKSMTSISTIPSDIRVIHDEFIRPMPGSSLYLPSNTTTERNRRLQIVAAATGAQSFIAFVPTPSTNYRSGQMNTNNSRVRQRPDYFSFSSSDPKVPHPPIPKIYKR
jgi:hypothetical protein